MVTTVRTPGTSHRIAVFLGLCLAPTWAWGQGLEKRTGRAFDGHTGDVRCVAFAPDGKTLLSGAEDGTIRFWDVNTGKELFRFTEDPPACVFDLAYAPDGKTVIASVEAPREKPMQDGRLGAVQFWDVETKKVRQTITFPGGVPMVLSPDGKTLATLAGGRAGIYDIYLWDGASGKQIGALDGGDVAPFSFAFTADSKTLGVGLEDGTVQLWDLGVKKVRASWQIKRLTYPYIRSAGESVAGMAFAPDDRSLMTTTGSRLYLSDVVNGKVCDQFDNRGCGGRRCLTYSPKGGFLAAGSPLWVMETSRCAPQYQLVGCKHNIEYLAYSPDGKWIAAACGKDRSVRIWQAPEE